MTTSEINLFSDTQTRPTPAMRQAMAQAEVGDEQSGRDPTVNALCERVAALLGKPAAVFLPSGTMCNQIALLVHCARGDEVICEETSHMINYEAGGGAAIAGAMFRCLVGRQGMFTAAQAERAIRPPSRSAPRSRLLVVEQSTNVGGGAVWPPAELAAVAAVARRHGLAMHMDGARLLNAVVAAQVPAALFAAEMDTVWIDFTKGLGCPFGAVLAGSASLIEHAHVWKQRLGGAMRQAGIMAAACLYALDHHVERLADDHAHAAALARGIAAIPGLTVEPVQTNMVFFDVAATGLDANTFSRAAAALGLRISAAGATRIRIVTHLDFPASAVPTALELIRQVSQRGPSA